MKVTKGRLKQIIKEELEVVLTNEEAADFFDLTEDQLKQLAENYLRNEGLGDDINPLFKAGWAYGYQSGHSRGQGHPGADWERYKRAKEEKEQSLDEGYGENPKEQRAFLAGFEMGQSAMDREMHGDDKLTADQAFVKWENDRRDGRGPDEIEPMGNQNLEEARKFKKPKTPKVNGDQASRAVKYAFFEGARSFGNKRAEDSAIEPYWESSSSRHTASSWETPAEQYLEESDDDEGVSHGDKCECGGTYGERSVYDDWDGTSTCDKCKTSKVTKTAKASRERQKLKEQ